VAEDEDALGVDMRVRACGGDRRDGVVDDFVLDVMSPDAAILPPYTFDRLSKRSTAMPREARPAARSAKGLFGPIVSSRSFGPEPWINTSAGKGPSPLGTVSVPGNFHSPVPTLMSDSVNDAGSAYDGALCGEAGAAAGRMFSPAIFASLSKTTRTSSVARSNAQVTTPI
jgi:hypothetical protein